MTHDLGQFERRGILAMAVNNAAAVVRPHLWTMVDDPGNFCDGIWRDPANAEMIHNEVTTFDHALSRPWTVHKTYVLQKKPIWIENICSVGNQHVQIGKEGYFLSADGLLMPQKKGQPAPDLRYFKDARN